MASRLYVYFIDEMGNEEQYCLYLHNGGAQAAYEIMAFTATGTPTLGVSPDRSGMHRYFNTIQDYAVQLICFLKNADDEGFVDSGGLYLQSVVPGGFGDSEGRSLIIDFQSMKATHDSYDYDIEEEFTLDGTFFDQWDKRMEAISNHEEDQELAHKTWDELHPDEDTSEWRQPEYDAYWGWIVEFIDKRRADRGDVPLEQSGFLLG